MKNCDNRNENFHRESVAYCACIPSKQNSSVLHSSSSDCVVLPLTRSHAKAGSTFLLFHTGFAIALGQYHLISIVRTY